MVGRHDRPRCSGSAILQSKCLGFFMRQMLFLRGGGQGIFEDFQFGSWFKVPRLCLFPCLLLPDWLLPSLRAGGPSVWALNAVGRRVGGSGPPRASPSACRGSSVSPPGQSSSPGRQPCEPSRAAPSETRPPGRLGRAGCGSGCWLGALGERGLLGTPRGAPGRAGGR